MNTCDRHTLIQLSHLIFIKVSLVLRLKQKWQYFMSIQRRWRMLLLFIYGEAISRNLTIRSCWKIIINSFRSRCLWMKFAFKLRCRVAVKKKRIKSLINIRKFAIALNGRFDCFIVLCLQKLFFFSYHTFHRSFYIQLNHCECFKIMTAHQTSKSINIFFNKIILSIYAKIARHNMIIDSSHKLYEFILFT